MADLADIRSKDTKEEEKEIDVSILCGPIRHAEAIANKVSKFILSMELIEVLNFLQ